MSEIPLFGRAENLPGIVGALFPMDVQAFDDPALGVRIRYGVTSDIAEQIKRHLLGGNPFAHWQPPPELDLSMFKCDVYLYDGGGAVPDSVNDPAVKTEMQESLDQVMLTAQSGAYESFEFQNSQLITLGHGLTEPNWAWAAFRFRMAPAKGVRHTMDRLSHIAIQTGKGYYHKIRYTYPAHFPSGASWAMFTAFLYDWQSAIARLTNDGDPSSDIHDEDEALHGRPPVELPSPVGFMDPRIADARQRELLSRHLSTGASGGRDPQYAIVATTHHEVNHVLLAAMEEDMALAVDYGGTARTYDLRDAASKRPDRVNE